MMQVGWPELVIMALICAMAAVPAVALLVVLLGISRASAREKRGKNPPS